MSNFQYLSIRNWKLQIGNSYRRQAGFSILEVILAVGMFALFSTGMIVAVIGGFDANRLGIETTIANEYTAEGMEAVRSIRNQSNGFATLAAKAGAGNQGVAISGGVWAFSGTSNTLASDTRFTRTIAVTSVSRDTSVVTYDNSQTSVSGAGVSSLTWAQTPTSGISNGIILVGVTLLSTTPSVFTITYNGVSLTKIDAQNTTNVETLGARRVELWYRTLVAGDIGASHNIVVTLTGGTTTIIGGSSIYYNVNASSPIGTSAHDINARASAGTTNGVTVNTTTGQLVVDYLGENNVTLSPVAGQTSNFIINDGGNDNTGFSSKAVSSTTTTMQWNINSSDWVDIAVPLNSSGNGNIVSSGGTTDGNTYKVVVTTTWNVNAARTDSVQLTEYFTSWKSKKGGMLAYNDTVTGANAILYKTFDASANTWSSASTLFPDGSATSSNAFQVMRMYSSKTRNEKIIISRHSNSSTTQTNIYASVWNGSTWTKQTLATWAATSANDLLNFDGTYLNNGDFMVVYSDNTTTPKFRTWNGSSWSAQLSVGSSALTGVPNWIVVSQRSGTNQAMAAFLTASSNTQTYYYNGNTTYAAANWGVFTTHATATPSTTKRIIDFEFNNSSVTTGTLVYADSATDKNLTVRVFTASGADGAGTGTWGTAVNAGTAQTNNLGAMNIEPRPTANEFNACDKDGGTTPTILCYKITVTGSVPTVVAPVTIATATDTGSQRSYDMQWENLSGDPMVAVYSDNTAVPKFKKFAAGTATWDASATSITTTGSPGIFKSVRGIPQDQGDDIMFLLADANSDVFSIFWNGSGNAMYTIPAAKAYTAHGVNGVATANFWYDFAWDKF